MTTNRKRYLTVLDGRDTHLAVEYENGLVMMLAESKWGLPMDDLIRHANLGLQAERNNT